MIHDLVPSSSAPAEVLEEIRAASRTRPVLVFKKSPTCPVSWRAEAQLRAWRERVAAVADVDVLVVDVLAERAVARGLTAELGIRHESPQALWFDGGEVVAHGSHGVLTVGWFEDRRAGTGAR